MIREKDIMAILLSVPVQTAIGGVHLALRRLTHGVDTYAGGESERILPSYGASHEEGVIADKLVEKIEATEGLPVSKVEKTEVDRYVVLLTSLLFKRIGEERPFNEVRGRALLAELRAA